VQNQHGVLHGPVRDADPVAAGGGAGRVRRGELAVQPRVVVPALAIIVTSGVLAFCLNFSIFYVIHSTAAVTFNVAGNLKVAVAVLASWAVFRNPVSGMNAVGCAVTLAGCTFYGCVRHLVSKKQKAAGSSPRTPRGRVAEMLPLAAADKQEDDKI
jgi:solute carrier family 35, member E3